MNTIPQHIQDDDALAGRLKLKLTEAVSRRLDESDWKKFSMLYGLDDYITDHHRFLRAQRFDDPDFEGHVLDLVKHLYDTNQAALLDLFNRGPVQRWFKEKDPEFLEIWEGKSDPLIEALSHGLDQVHQLIDTVDLRQHTQRIQSALPNDPSQAIGATKDMLEATMRTILHTRGHSDVDKLDYPALSTACLTELGLRANTAPASADEKYVRKIASSAKAMIDAANELRNAAGTGHGRVVGEQPAVSSNDASLVASTGLILAAWMLRQSRDG